MNAVKNIILRPEVVSGFRIIIAIGPTVLSYHLLNNQPQDILIFLKIISGYSLVATISTLGLGGYVYALISKREIAQHSLDVAIEIVVWATFLTLIVILALSLMNEGSMYLLLMASFVTIASWSSIELQAAMAAKDPAKVLLIGSAPSLLFTVIAISIFIIGKDLALVLMSFANFMASIIIAYVLYKRKKYKPSLNIEMVKKTKMQISNGVVCSGVPPIVMLLILSIGEGFATVEQFTVYVLYTKLYDGASAYCNSLFLTKYFHELKSVRSLLSVASLKIYLIAGFFLITLTNIGAFLISGQVLIAVSILECLIFFLKLLVSSVALMILTESPKILVLKEVFIGMSFMSLWLIGINSILGLQVVSAIIYTCALGLIIKFQANYKICKT